MEIDKEFNLTSETTVKQEVSNVGNYIPNPNARVTIADPSPVIILFGAGASGKTMTLIRLTKYLIQNKYKVEPEKTFLSSKDSHYEDMCKNFMSIVNSNRKPDRNQVIDFMLVKVMDEYGRPICQILEAPGEHYFDPLDSNRVFPNYLNTISQINNRKTWVFIVEKDWESENVRELYAQKITNLQQNFVSDADKVIFTCHKADLHPLLFNATHSNNEQFLANIKNQYRGIFSKYKNQNPITKLWREYNFDFVVFSAGLFNDDNSTYADSNNKYPATLWQSILKTVKGSWWN